MAPGGEATDGRGPWRGGRRRAGVAPGGEATGAGPTCIFCMAALRPSSAVVWALRTTAWAPPPRSAPACVSTMARLSFARPLISSIMSVAMTALPPSLAHARGTRDRHGETSLPANGGQAVSNKGFLCFQQRPFLHFHTKQTHQAGLMDTAWNQIDFCMENLFICVRETGAKAA